MTMSNAVRECKNSGLFGDPIVAKITSASDTIFDSYSNLAAPRTGPVFLDRLRAISPGVRD